MAIERCDTCNIDLTKTREMKLAHFCSNDDLAARCNELTSILEDILNSAETAGCEGCATVGLAEINAGREAFGWEPLEEEEVIPEPFDDYPG